MTTPATRPVAATRPSAEPAARPAPARPSMHELWVQAGGGTDAYDPDRYLGLLRDHGWALPRRPLTAILVDVLQECREQAADPETLAAAVAPRLVEELHRYGFRIHDVARCVRPSGAHPHTVGRPMTPEEEAALGVKP